MGTIFSVGPGSKGDRTPSYSIHLPFTLSPDRTLKLEEGFGSFELLGRQWEVQGEEPKYFLRIRSFDSEGAAATFFERVQAGFYWVGLNSSFGFRFSANVVPVVLFDQPTPVSEESPFAPIANKRGWSEIDGHYEASQTAIVPEHKRLTVFSAGSVRARMDMPLSLFAERMSAGMSAERPELVSRSRKLRLACEVFFSSHFESTPTASFLTRITTMEILAADIEASTPTQKLVSQFVADAQNAKIEHKKDVEVLRDFESLISRLNYLRNRSIKSGIRELLADKLKTDPEIKEPAEVAKEVSRLYDLRSALVHTGEVEPKSIENANNRLQDIVPRILRVLYREAADGP